MSAKWHINHVHWNPAFCNTLAISLRSLLQREPLSPHHLSLPINEQGVVKSDPILSRHTDHLQYRWQQYTKTKEAIEKAEGSLTNFALVNRALYPRRMVHIIIITAVWWISVPVIIGVVALCKPLYGYHEVLSWIVRIKTTVLSIMKCIMTAILILHVKLLHLLPEKTRSLMLYWIVRLILDNLLNGAANYCSLSLMMLCVHLQKHSRGVWDNESHWWS
jgi:hypothetical protein